MSGLEKLVQDIEPTTIVNTGATELRNIVAASDLPKVLIAYNLAIRQCFVVTCIMGCIALPGALLVRWNSVKGKQGPGEEKSPESEKKEQV